ncbi:MAG: hemolysin family protein [Clostridia bacterium]|nr:hemolysin family protein [Clostridia bacterium]
MIVGDPLPRQLLLQFILILLSAFFSCAEIAVLSTNENKVRKAADSGKKNARRLLSLMQEPTRFLATIQIGNTLAGFMSTAFAASSFSEGLATAVAGWGVGIPLATLHTLSVIFIALILALVMIVFGELVPKRIALQNAERISMAIAGMVHGFFRITAPVVWFLTTVTNGILRVFGIDPNKRDNGVTEEEIRMMVDLGEETGSIAPDEGEMIDNVLALGSKTAVELMTHRTDVAVLWLEDDEATWEKTIIQTTHTRYPVCDEDIDSIVGILHVRDFFCNMRAPKPKPAQKLLRSAYFVPETAQADAMLREMKRTKNHLAVVVDEYGGTSGIVSMEDLLEEIVGEIEDEHDRETPDIVSLGDNRWRVNGGIAIDDLAEALGAAFPEGDYDTLGGMIFAQMNAIPEDGSTPELDIAGLHIKVTELTDHRVAWAEMWPTEPETEVEKAQDS